MLSPQWDESILFPWYHSNCTEICAAQTFNAGIRAGLLKIHPAGSKTTFFCSFYRLSPTACSLKKGYRILLFIIAVQYENILTNNEKFVKSVGMNFCRGNSRIARRYNYTGGHGDPPLLFWGLSRVRVSGGHLCAAETPTEPTGETADPYNAKINNKNSPRLTVRSIWHIIKFIWF